MTSDRVSGQLHGLHLLGEEFTPIPYHRLGRPVVWRSIGTSEHGEEESVPVSSEAKGDKARSVFIGPDYNGLIHNNHRV